MLKNKLLKFIVWLVVADLCAVFIFFTSNFYVFPIKLVYAVGTVILNIGSIYILKNHGENIFDDELKNSKSVKFWSVLVTVFYIIPLWISFIFD